MRVFFGIVLLAVCILLVGAVALHMFSGVSHPPRTLIPDAGHVTWLPREVTFDTQTYQRTFFSLFALGGLGFLILLLGGLGFLLLFGGRSKQTKAMNGEETRIIQEIYEGLSRMEKRVETLETILLERSSKQEV